MNRKVKELRGLIYKSYDSEADFARKLGWPRQRVYRITNGLKEPSVSELNNMAEVLNKSVGDLAQIFLHHASPNEQQEAKQAVS